MTPIAYDFERAHAAGVHSKWAGFTNETWGYSLNSELLPGFDFSSNYSLFQGSPLSDTARIQAVPRRRSPRRSTSAAGRIRWRCSRDLFGKAVPGGAEVADARQPIRFVRAPTTRWPRSSPRTPVAGTMRGGDRFIIPPSQGWRAQFQFSRSSPRPPVAERTS